jgi:hypothetical protein
MAESRRWDAEAESLRQSVGSAFKTSEINDAKARAAAARTLACAIRAEAEAAKVAAEPQTTNQPARACSDTARRKLQSLANGGNRECQHILAHADKYWSGNVLAAVSDAEDGKITPAAWQFAKRLPVSWKFAPTAL